MELRNEREIAASQATVWAALNDPAVLKASIPGCEELERVDEHTLRARVKSKVGPISAGFSGVVKLSDVDPPNGYTISFHGEGGAAGFVKGNARVDLIAAGSNTLLRYVAQAQVGGKLAQVGSRLIDNVAAKTASDFFARFGALVAEDRSAAAVDAPQPGSPPPSVAHAPGAAAPIPSRTAKYWIVGAVVLAGALLLWLVRR